MEISKNSQQNNSETISNDHDREVPKESYVSPEERQIIINNLRLIWYYNNRILKNDNFFAQYTKSGI